MNKESNTMPYLKYFIEGLPPELVKKAEIELGETEEVRTQSLKEIRQLIKEEPDFQPYMEDTFLLRFLRVKKFNVDKAFTTLKNYYKDKAIYSGISTDLRPSDVKEVLDADGSTALEYRDSNGAAIGYIQVAKLAEFSPDQLIATILICAEIGVKMEATQVSGYFAILDYTDFSLLKAKKLASPSFLCRFVTAIQDVTPCRMKGLHVVNEPSYMSFVFSVARTFMKEKLKKRVHIHGTNFKSLHKHISPDILPEELGGKQGPMSNFLQVYKERIYSLEEHFKKLNSHGYQGDTLKQLTKNNSADICI